MTPLRNSRRPAEVVYAIYTYAYNNGGACARTFGKLGFRVNEQKRHRRRAGHVARITPGPGIYILIKRRPYIVTRTNGPRVRVELENVIIGTRRGSEILVRGPPLDPEYDKLHLFFSVCFFFSFPPSPPASAAPRTVLAAVANSRHFCPSQTGSLLFFTPPFPGPPSRSFSPLPLPARFLLFYLLSFVMRITTRPSPLARLMTFFTDCTSIPF